MNEEEADRPDDEDIQRIAMEVLASAPDAARPALAKFWDFLQAVLEDHSREIEHQLIELQDDSGEGWDIYKAQQAEARIALTMVDYFEQASATPIEAQDQTEQEEPREE